VAQQQPETPTLCDFEPRCEPSEELKPPAEAHCLGFAQTDTNIFSGKTLPAKPQRKSFLAQTREK